MKNQFEQRFEEELQKILTAVQRKGGVKKQIKYNNVLAGPGSGTGPYNGII